MIDRYSAYIYRKTVGGGQVIDLEAIKARQRRFACFCWRPGGPKSEYHHPECMSADINQDVRDLIAELEVLRDERKASQELRKERFE